ncbi:hypothetical protein ACFFNU_16865, partial [Sphingomonas yabuuchiae]
IIRVAIMPHRCLPQCRTCGLRITSSARRGTPDAYVVPSLPVFAEVQVAEPVVRTPQLAPCPPGLIQIVLPSGVRVSVDAAVDAGALTRVLSVLR